MSAAHEIIVCLARPRNESLLDAVALDCRGALTVVFLAVRIFIFVMLALIPLAFIGWMVRDGRRAPAPAAAAAGKARASGAEADQGLLALFQGDLGGAKVKEKVTLYDEKGLFDYIDGAAPIFIQRHFRKLAAADMASAEGSDMDCAVYDMAEPANAQSIFDAEKSATAKPVAEFPDAISGPMSFVFRAGRYYVKMTAFDKKAEAALPGLAKALKGKMK
jgi:hypothetical protein